MTQFPTDPALEAVRKVRHEISAEIDHDPKRLLEYYRRLEEEYADRLVHSIERIPTPPTVAG